MRADVRPVYAMADAFVLPSSYETFSLVAFEAAASGLPGDRERRQRRARADRQRRERLSGRTAAEQIATRLRELAADPRLRARLGAAARESALRFRWEQMVREHEELYERLAAAGGRL